MSTLPIAERALPPTRIRIEGQVIAIHAGDRHFTLRGRDGTEIQATYIGRSIAELASLLGSEVVVFGNDDSHGIQADGFLPLTGAVVISPNRLPLTPEEMQEMSTRLGKIIGTWPGNESDEEIEAALREIR